MERVEPLLLELDRVTEGRIVLVTHGVMSRAILTRYLALYPAEADNVRHPNDLFYHLTWRADRVEPAFYRDGVGPVAGLLRRSASETILR